MFNIFRMETGKEKANKIRNISNIKGYNNKTTFKKENTGKYKTL